MTDRKVIARETRMDRNQRMAMLKGILDYAMKNPRALVVDGRIEVKPSETDEEYMDNHAFWTNIFKMLCAADPISTLETCTFFHQKPDVPIPLTKFEELQKFVGIEVIQKTTPGEIVEIETRRPSVALMDIQALANGMLYIGFDEAERDRLEQFKLKMSVLMLPITHPYRLYLQAGHIKSVALA